jgi:hypothetical protein
MTDRPYTDDDLRIEAARQHVALTEDPDFMGVGKQMDDEEWRSLSADDFTDAQRRIHGLISSAADVSEWAINLGADGLEPLPEQLSAQTDYGPWFRLHFAVRPDMPDAMRRTLVEGVAFEIAKFFPTPD